MKIRKVWLPVGTLVGLPLVLYAPFLFGGKVLYWGVYLLQFYPWRQLAVEQIRAGHWPLWNPYLGAGTPLAANLQTAAFYPPNVLFLLMPVEQALGWSLALHVALAGLSAYTLGRTLGLSRFAALVAGLSYGLGGYVTAHWVFPSMVYAAAWLPLMLALTEQLIRNTEYETKAYCVLCIAYCVMRSAYCVFRIALLAVAVAMQLLAGHAQTSFYSLLIVAAFALYRLWQRRSPNFPISQFTGLFLAVLWGLALSAIQLLPTAELAAHSQRAGRLTDLQFAFELSFWPWRFITLLAPDFFGNPARSGYWAYGTYWEEAAYVGILPLLLAALALAAWWRKRKSSPSLPLSLSPFLFFLSLLSLLLALGNHTPLYPLLFRYAPGFGLFQAPARLLIGYALAVPLLAGIGADALRLTPRTRRALRVLVLVGGGMAVAGGLARLILPDLRPSFGASTLRLGLTLALTAGLLLLWGARFRRKNGWLTTRNLQLATWGLVAADLLAFGWELAPGAEPSVYRAPVAAAGFLQSQPPGRILVAPDYADEVYDRYVSLHAFGSTDPAYLQGLRESLLPNLNAVHHLAGVGNYDPLTVGSYRDLYDRCKFANLAICKSANLQICKFFSVRYVITDAEMLDFGHQTSEVLYSNNVRHSSPFQFTHRRKCSAGDFRSLYSSTCPKSREMDLPLIYDAGPRIYRYDGALPEAFVVPRARVIEDPEARLAALFDPAFDPRAEVILSRQPEEGELTATEEPGLQPTPTLLRQGPNRVIIQVKMDRAGYLVLTDTDYPGWRAMVDGEPAEILPANHAFRAVALGAGEHTVIFEYAPLSFRVGAWITAGAILWLMVGLFVGRRLR